MVNSIPEVSSYSTIDPPKPLINPTISYHAYILKDEPRPGLQQPTRVKLAVGIFAGVALVGSLSIAVLWLRPR